MFGVWGLGVVGFGVWDLGLRAKPPTTQNPAPSVNEPVL